MSIEPEYAKAMQKTQNDYERCGVESLDLTPHKELELNRFCQQVTQKAEWKSARIFVFGSTANGHVFPFSDIDVAVQSDAFISVPWAERTESLRKLCEPGSPISPIGVTGDEMRRGHKGHPSILRSLHSSNAIEIIYVR